MMFKEKNITKFIIFIPIFFILLIILISLYSSITLLNKHFESDYKKSEQQELELQKQYIKSQVDSAYDYILYKKTESIHRLKEKIRKRIYTAHDMMEKIYFEDKDKLSKSQLEEKIINIMSKIRFDNNGYFFIIHIKSNKELIAKMIPSKIEMENTNTYSNTDVNGKLYSQIMAKVVSNEIGEGYVTYFWNKLTDSRKFEKISFVKLFKPYNWFIGYGEYLDDFESDIKEEVKSRLDLYRFNKNGYIWTHDTNHTLLQHPFREKSIGINDYDLTDKVGTKIIQKFVKNALKDPKGNYVEYYWNKPNQKYLTKKIGYVRHIPDWNWVIGAGVYLDDINILLNDLKSKKETYVTNAIYEISIYFAIILFVVIFLSIIVSKKINNTFLSYRNKINDKQRELEEINSTLELKVYNKTKELSKLNDSLEEKIKIGIKEIKIKDKKIIEQSKMAALGEMIGNIAHQWRQPLNVISVSASGLKMQNELKILKDKDINEFTDSIIKNSEYLSEVIDDFRNYIKNDKEITTFDVSDIISKSLSIFNTTIKNNKINIIRKDEKDVVVSSYFNELLQAVVTILNNSNDALIENNESNFEKIIIISTYKLKNKAYLSIQDNAGGINENILNKIFEPYFTTKHKSVGTGLGLYMVYNIVTDSLDGVIEVKNETFNHNGKFYKGAKFIISLPLD